jgi:hypothetical protein
MIERFRVALESVFAGGIDSLVRPEQESEDGADVGYAPTPFLPHDWENCLAHSEDAEKIGFKRCPGFLNACLFQRADESQPALLTNESILPA